MEPPNSAVLGSEERLQDDREKLIPKAKAKRGKGSPLWDFVDSVQPIQTTEGSQMKNNQNLSGPSRLPFYRVILPSVAYFGIQGRKRTSAIVYLTTQNHTDLRDTHVSYVWLIAPLSGCFVQPLVGVLSDRCRSPFGRRRPFMTFGVVLVITGLLLFGFSEAIGIKLGDDDSTNTHPAGLAFAIVAFVILDIGIQSLQAPLRALLADTTPSAQHHVANADFAVANGLGKTIGFVCGAFIKNIQLIYGIAAASVIITSTIVIVCVNETPQTVSSSMKNRDSKTGLCRRVVDFTSNAYHAMTIMPTEVFRAFIVESFSHMGWVCLFTFGTDWVGKEIWLGNADAPQGSPDKLLFDEGVRSANLGLSIMAGTSAVFGLILPWLMSTIGAKSVWFLCLSVLSGILIGTHFIGTNHHAAVGLMGGLGLSLAGGLTIPWSILTVTLADNDHKGLYMALFHLSHGIPGVIIRYMDNTLTFINFTHSLMGGLIVHAASGDISVVLVVGGCSAGMAALLVLFVQLPKNFYTGNQLWVTSDITTTNTNIDNAENQKKEVRSDNVPITPLDV